ncbi:unnamed protein product [Lasius platythorax]|uniref:Uncharacterized protein n=1 Tax=Lasius platythorax TaxID=488582 RepID=A0AAV2N1U5_9HYME
MCVRNCFYFEMENYLKPKTIWVRDKPFWSKKIKRAPLNEISSEVEKFSNYDDDRQLPRISKTIISDARKLSSFMRSPDLALLPQVELLSSDKTKLDSTKPTVLISIGIQERKNANDNSQEDFSRIKNHRKHSHAWLIEQPFYVEEPTWINLYPDMDSSSQDNTDPYILSRGKKIFRIKDTEQAEKTIENYEDFPNKYPSRSKRLSMKSRVRRSVEMKKKSQNNTVNDNEKDQKKEINYYNFLQDTDSNNMTMTKSQDKKSYKIDKISEDRKTKEDTILFHNIFIKKYQKDKIKNLMEKLPYEFKFIKQNRTSVNDEKIINFAEQKQNIQREDISNHIKNDNSKSAKISRDKKFNNQKSSFPININKRNKRSVLLKNKNFSEVRKKYKTQEISTSSEKNVERNKTDVYEQMKNKAYVDKLDDLNTYNDDTFILSSKKSRLDNRTESSNKKDIDHNKYIERPWTIQYYAYHKKLQSEEEPRNEKKEPGIDKNDTEATDSQLTSKSDSESSQINNYFNLRKKRSACRTCKLEPQLQDQWLKDIGREIQDSSLERRNKHSDILEDLSLLEPYVISRGKKASHEFENGIYSTSESRNVDDADRIKVTSFPLAKALLRMLLMEMSGCNNCNINANRLSNKRSPRDRRSSLDEIFAPYDPYYAVRGKRINLDNFLTKMQSLRNQKSASFKTDGKQ